MKLRRIETPRPFAAKPAKVSASFSIGRFAYEFQSTPDGYTLRSGDEKLTVAYKGARASAVVGGGGKRTTVQLDLANPRVIRLAIASGSGKWRGKGSAEKVLAGAVQAGLTYPRIPALRVLFYQRYLSPDFSAYMARLSAPVIPVLSGPVFLIDRSTMCKVACSLCAAQMILTPGPTPDDLPACLACGLCIRMGWV